MHEQCADGEDELDDVHHCSLIPAGARCNFDHDLSSPVGCYGWRLFSGSSNSSMRELNSTTETQQHLIALMTKDTVAMGGTAQMLPPREHEIVYTYALSPKFPPPLHEGSESAGDFKNFPRGNLSPSQATPSGASSVSSTAAPARLPSKYSKSTILHRNSNVRKCLDHYGHQLTTTKVHQCRAGSVSGEGLLCNFGVHHQEMLKATA
jgi:hypothetical protein